MKGNQSIPFAERIKGQAVQGGVESLDVLSQPPPFFFQGLAALTGLRCQRENLECWLRWHDALLQEQRRPNHAHKNSPVIPSFRVWLLWGTNDLLTSKSAAALFHLLLEPMYWLEESVYSQEGVSSNVNN